MIGTAGAVAPRALFVGRQAELDILSSAMESARAAQPQIVWIEGEPGIGKTAFVRRFLTTVEDVVVLEASGEESETALDYGVVLQLVAKATPASSRAEREEQIAGRSPASSFAVGADLLAMLGTVQDSAPVVIAVDDAHWIDAPSAGALLFALRRLHGDRVLVLIVSRPDGLAQLGPSWSRLLADPDRVQRIRLSGLSGSEVNQLADSLGIGPLTLAAGERLREHTGGHPLYVKALLGELPLEQAQLRRRRTPRATFVLGHGARAADRDRRRRAESRGGGGGRRRALPARRSRRAVAGLDDPLPALEEALAAELLGLVPARLPEEIAFPHPLVRAAIYDDLSPTRRRALASRLRGARLGIGVAGAPRRREPRRRRRPGRRAQHDRGSRGLGRAAGGWGGATAVGLAHRRQRVGAGEGAAASGRVPRTVRRHSRCEQPPRVAAVLRRQRPEELHDRDVDRGGRAFATRRRRRSGR